MSRRRFLLAAGALAAAPLARAQPTARLPTLGILSPFPQPTLQHIANNPFTNRLRALGWIEGETLAIARAYTAGREDLLPAMAASLVREQADVIWTIGPHAALAAARATKSIPIVFWGVAYPVEQGLVQSLARPGGNLTGVASTGSPEVHAKRLQLLREIAPATKRLALLVSPSTTRTLAGEPTALNTKAYAAAAGALGFELRDFEFESTADLEAAFRALGAWHADCVTADGFPQSFRARRRIAAFATGSGRASAFAQRDFVEAGGLVSYAFLIAPTIVRCAHYVDLVLRGASPAGIPVELPSVYDIAVNLRTARALGLEVPRPLLLRADKVFE
jgi:putative ABC transport system substrate-binding protein